VPDAHLLKDALAEVVRQAADVVHVRMAEGDIRRGKREARAHADIERDIKLGNLNDGLFAGDTDP
jgi:hypothetical protein